MSQDNFTGQNISSTFQRLLQLSDNGNGVTDGTGSLVTFLPINVNNALTASYVDGVTTFNTGSFLITASIDLNTITFTKGDGSSFPITVNTGSGGSGTPTFPYTGSAIISGSLTITGSLNAPSITGSLFGTASYALNGGVTQILAGSNISLSPTNGLGQVTIISTGGGNTATGSYGSFYSTVTQTNVASTARSMSLNVTDISNGVSISGSTNPYNTYIKTENPGIYDIQFSAQVDKTDSGTDEIWIWLRKNGVNVDDTATSVQLVGNGAHYVAAWNFFVNSSANDYYQLMWYSPDANVRLHAEPAFGVVPAIPSLIVTANRVDQFLSNTGSFTGSFTGNLIGTASYVTGSIFTSTNLALSASYALTASYVEGVTSLNTGSFLITASVDLNTITFTKGNNSQFSLVIDTGSNSGGPESDPIFTAKSASLATTGSNAFIGNQTITGSLIHGLEGNTATGEHSHAEGSITKAIGNYSHAEGDNTQAKGDYSHAEGQETIASGSYSHAEGYGTIALGDRQHVTGQYNFVSPVQSAFIVGNGTDDGNRSNLIHAAGNEVQISGSFSLASYGSTPPADPPSKVGLFYFTDTDLYISLQ